MRVLPKKSLGQNFLINKGIVEKIIKAAELVDTDNILEIGPGLGVLTEELLKSGAKVVAVEKDKNLFYLLREKFKDIENLTLVNADILKITNYELQITNYKLIANIPYNITGAILRKFLLAENRPKFAVLMVQKEVGERLLGRGDRSILSIVAELYGKAKKICDVSPGSFNPPPKVRSQVIKLVAGKKQAEEFRILRLAKLGFSKKRKKLSSNLSTGMELDKNKIEQALLDIGLGENVRAEELCLNDWLKLAKLILK